MKNNAFPYIQIPLLNDLIDAPSEFLKTFTKSSISSSSAEEIVQIHKQEWRGCLDLDFSIKTELLRTCSSTGLVRDIPSLSKWLSDSIIADPDEAAVNKFDDLYRIDIDGTAASLVELNDLCAEFVTHLLEGRIGTAIRLVPTDGFRSGDDGKSYAPDMVDSIVGIMLKVWIARDLQLRAFCTRELFHRPTALQFLDHSENFLPVRQDTVINRILPAIDLADRAIALFETKRDISADEAADFPLDLQVQAQQALAKWQSAHPDDLEDHIERTLRKPKMDAHKLRKKLHSIKNNPSDKRKRMHALFDEAPLIGLWLAVCDATTWFAPEVGTTKGCDGQDITLPMDYAERVVTAARTGKATPKPKPRKQHMQTKLQLFFALRCTIVRDPEHLPKKLREVVTPAGQSMTAPNRERAEELRGRPFSFGEIFNYVEKRRGDRNSKEVLSHAFTGEANKFLKRHADKPTRKSRKIMKRAGCSATKHLRA